VSRLAKPFDNGHHLHPSTRNDSIQTIALLLSEPRKKPSLVVAPVVALMQWKHEIEKNAEGFTVRILTELAQNKADADRPFVMIGLFMAWHWST
jgi:hypothetical protein